MGGLQPGTTDRMIDRTVEDALEPTPICHHCGHEVDYHDQYGCYAPSIKNFDGHDPFETPCDCKEFSLD